MFTLGLWWGEIEGREEREVIYVCVTEGILYLWRVTHSALSAAARPQSEGREPVDNIACVRPASHCGVIDSRASLCTLLCVCVALFCFCACRADRWTETQSNVYEGGEDGCHFHREQPPSPVTLSFSFTVYLSGLCSLLLPSLLSTLTHTCAQKKTHAFSHTSVHPSF